MAEGEEEIGSPHFPGNCEPSGSAVSAAKMHRSVHAVCVAGTQRRCDHVSGAKGVVELELTSSGEKWGRGPKKDIHSSNKARVDSPAWHLVEALATLVSADGNDPVIEGFAAKARPAVRRR